MPCWEEDQGRMGVRRGWMSRLGDLGEALEGARTYTTRRTCTWGSTCETMSEWSMTPPRVINSPAGDRPSDFGRNVRRRRVALLIGLLHGLRRGIITWHVMRVGHSFLTRRRWGHVSVGRVHAVRRHVPIGSGWVTSAAVYVKSGTAGMGRGDGLGRVRPIGIRSRSRRWRWRSGVAIRLTERLEDGRVLGVGLGRPLTGRVLGIRT